ncbi:MAG: hydroxyacid dehydrogenase [bacterium]
MPEVREPRAVLNGLLAPYGEVCEGGVEKLSEEELVRAAGEWSAVIPTSREFITERVLEAAPKLKIIAKLGVGVENIDIPAATRRGIPVTNCPGSNATAVAEAALGLILAAVRRIPQSMRALQEGAWREAVGNSNELSGAVFGIVGFGNVGRELARLLAGFGGRILAADAYVPGERIRAGGAEPVDLDTLTREADVVSIHCSLTPETRRLFGADRFRAMKKSAVIVNCARGGIIDEAALIAALKGGEIAGAGIDVFEEEPPARDNPLFSLPNAVVTPHLAGATHQARERVFRIAAENVIRAVRGERVVPSTLLNPEVYER